MKVFEETEMRYHTLRVIINNDYCSPDCDMLQARPYFQCSKYSVGLRYSLCTGAIRCKQCKKKYKED